MELIDLLLDAKGVEIFPCDDHVRVYLKDVDIRDVQIHLEAARINKERAEQKEKKACEG